MLRRLRLGPLVALGTLAAMAGTLVMAAPSGAVGGEKEYATNFEMECVVAPGVLNIKAKEKLKVALSATGPAETTTGEEATFTKAHSTITSPVELTESFVSLGANEVKGTATMFVLDNTGAEPASLNIVKPAEFPSGIPFLAAAEKGKPGIFNVPSLTLGETSKTYSFGPIKTTATSGNVVSTVNTEPGFTEPEPGSFKETGHGIITEVEGRSSGSHVIGPLKSVCNAPAGVTAASIPVRPAVTTTTTKPVETTTTTTTTKPVETTTTTTTTTTKPVTTTTTTTTTTPSEQVEVKFNNWKLEGSLTIKKLNETIHLPEGCTFNGEAKVPGPLTGNTACPNFTATVKIFNLLPSTLSLSFVEAGPVTGTITPAKEGKLLFKATAKDNILIHSVSILGLTIPTSCTTKEPAVFPLETEAPASALATGASFSGHVTLPAVQCSGGLLGAVFGPVLTLLFSGPENPFAFTIHP
jgi:hypothetical protein